MTARRDRGPSLTARRAVIEQAIETGQATHVHRGYGYERIVSLGDRYVHVEPIFGGRARVPYAAINTAATIAPFEREEGP